MQVGLDREDLERFIRLTQDMFAIAEGDRLVWVSTAWTEILGWSREELGAAPYLSYVHPDDVPATLESAKGIARGEPVIQFTNRYRHKDGGYRWLEWNASPQPDGRMFCVTREVSARKAQEATLNHHTRLYALAEEVFRAGHWYVDLVENTLYWSHEIYRIHGRDPATFTPDLASGIDAYHPDDREKVTAVINRAIEEREPFHFELRILRPSGEERLVESVGQPVSDHNDQVIGILGVFRDITDDWRVRRNAELEQFARVAAHDLRGPVTTVSNYLHLLETECDMSLEGEGLRFWEYVRRSMRRLGRLVQDLSRYTDAGQEVRLQLVDLNRSLESVVAEIGAEFKARRPQIDVLGPLPHVWGHATRLEQVFDNLLRNAVRFAGDAPAHVTIRALDEGAEGTVTVAVSDEGVGFKQDYAEQIFEPFRRLVNDDDGGTGIGLALVRQFVESFGGDVWAHGTKGRGATFFVRLQRGTGREAA